MKKLWNLAIVLVAVVAINACGPNKNSPEYVAETFLKHMNKKEFAEAKKLGTEATVSFLETKEQDTSMVAKDVKIEDMKCVVTDGTAICNYKVDGKDETINLVKNEDKWLVDMKKEQNMNDMNDMVNSVGEDFENAITEGTEAVEEATEAAEAAMEEVK
jgi:hypothetical protein